MDLKVHLTKNKKIILLTLLLHTCPSPLPQMCVHSAGKHTKGSRVIFHIAKLWQTTRPNRRRNLLHWSQTSRRCSRQRVKRHPSWRQLPQHLFRLKLHRLLRSRPKDLHRQRRRNRSCPTRSRLQPQQQNHLPPPLLLSPPSSHLLYPPPDPSPK